MIETVHKITCFYEATGKQIIKIEKAYYENILLEKTATIMGKESYVGCAAAGPSLQITCTDQKDAQALEREMIKIIKRNGGKLLA